VAADLNNVSRLSTRKRIRNGYKPENIFCKAFTHGKFSFLKYGAFLQAP
jgi:hypothetical protein